MLATLHRAGMDALRKIGSGVTPTEAMFMAGRNNLMIRFLLRNGQRTGAVRNLTCLEVENRRNVKDVYIIQVNTHKTASKFVCQLVLDEKLNHDVDTWARGRKLFLREKVGEAVSNDLHKAFFCDCKGDFLFSNELSRITRSVIGGSVTQMRKAQYYLVNFHFCALLSKVIL